MTTLTYKPSEHSGLTIMVHAKEITTDAGYDGIQVRTSYDNLTGEGPQLFTCSIHGKDDDRRALVLDALHKALNWL